MEAMEEAPAVSLVIHGRNADEGDLTVLVTREGYVFLRGDLRRVEVPDGPQVVALAGETVATAVAAPVAVAAAATAATPATVAAPAAAVAPAAVAGLPGAAALIAVKVESLQEAAGPAAPAGEAASPAVEPAAAPGAATSSSEETTSPADAAPAASAAANAAAGPAAALLAAKAAAKPAAVPPSLPEPEVPGQDSSDEMVEVKIEEEETQWPGDCRSPLARKPRRALRGDEAVAEAETARRQGSQSGRRSVSKTSSEGALGKRARRRAGKGTAADCASGRVSFAALAAFERLVVAPHCGSRPLGAPRACGILPQRLGALWAAFCTRKAAWPRAARCRASQHVAAHRGVLPPIAACCRPSRQVAARRRTLPPVAARCRPSRRVAANRGTLPPAAARCRPSRHAAAQRGTLPPSAPSAARGRPTRHAAAHRGMPPTRRCFVALRFAAQCRKALVPLH
ncbi:unnamed protein product [Effrenium voratum]|nr:unnamed protein product [Effrenium voratum]